MSTTPGQYLGSYFVYRKKKFYEEILSIFALPDCECKLNIHQVKSRVTGKAYLHCLSQLL